MRAILYIKTGKTLQMIDAFVVPESTNHISVPVYSAPQLQRFSLGQAPDHQVTFHKCSHYAKDEAMFVASLSERELGDISK